MELVTQEYRVVAGSRKDGTKQQGVLIVEGASQLERDIRRRWLVRHVFPGINVTTSLVKEFSHQGGDTRQRKKLSR